MFSTKKVVVMVLLLGVLCELHASSLSPSPRFLGKFGMRSQFEFKRPISLRGGDDGSVMAYTQEKRPLIKSEMDKHDMRMSIASALKSLLSGKFGKSMEKSSDTNSTEIHDVKEENVMQQEMFVSTEQLPDVAEKQETFVPEELEAEEADSGAAETPDVQVQLYEMRNKISSLRQTQSELRAKMARYQGEEPKEGESCDEPMPENLNMKVMLETNNKVQQELDRLAKELGV